MREVLNAVGRGASYLGRVARNRARELKPYFDQGLTTVQDAVVDPWGNPKVAPTLGTAGQPTPGSVDALKRMPEAEQDPTTVWGQRAKEMAAEQEREKGKDKGPEVEM